jgi:hypothetical protein
MELESMRGHAEEVRDVSPDTRSPWGLWGDVEFRPLPSGNYRLHFENLPRWARIRRRRARYEMQLEVVKLTRSPTVGLARVRSGHHPHLTTSLDGGTVTIGVDE